MKKILQKLIVLSLSLLGLTNVKAQNYQWTKSFGGIYDDYGTSLILGFQGDIYTTGRYAGTVDFDPGPGVYNLTTSSKDIFVSKLDPQGNFLWAKSMGGPLTEDVFTIDVDSFGNVYTAGSFVGTADFDPGTGTFNLSTNGGNDIFVSKLDASGNFVWAKNVGGVQFDFATSLILDGANNVYVTGWFSGTVDFDPGAGVANLTSSGGYDSFLLKLDSFGNILWVHKAGGNSDDDGRSLAIDTSGNVYLMGSFNGVVDFDPGVGVFNLTSMGNRNVFVSKMDSTGGLLWARNFGGNVSSGRSIEVDFQGNIYITGGFDGTVDFDPGLGVANLTSSGNRDAFVLKLDVSGDYVWAKKMGGTSRDSGGAIALDLLKNTYVTGSFKSVCDFDPGPLTYSLNSVGNKDVFICKLDSAGDFVWARSMGGIDNDAGISIDVDAYGGVYTTGFFEEVVDFDPGIGGDNITSASRYDAFIQKLGNCPTISTSVSGSDISSNQTGATYQWLDCNNGYTSIAGANNVNYTATTDGDYAVAVTVNGCTDTSACVNVSTVGIDENEIGASVNIYPNPATGEVTIDLGGIKNAQISIVNITGQEVYRLKDVISTKMVISLNDFNKGIYLVKIITKEGVVSQQFVKQ